MSEMKTLRKEKWINFEDVSPPMVNLPPLSNRPMLT